MLELIKCFSPQVGIWSSSTPAGHGGAKDECTFPQAGNDDNYELSKNHCECNWVCSFVEAKPPGDLLSSLGSSVLLANRVDFATDPSPLHTVTSQDDHSETILDSEKTGESEPSVSASTKLYEDIVEQQLRYS